MKNHIPFFCVLCVLFFFSAVSASTYSSLVKNNGVKISREATIGLAKSAASDTIMMVKELVYDGKDSLADVFNYSFDQKLRPFKRTGYSTFNRFEYDKRDVPVVTATCNLGSNLLQWFTTSYDSLSLRLIRDSYYYCPSRTMPSNLTSSRYNYDSLTGMISREDFYDQYGFINYSLNYSYDQAGNLVKVYAPGIERVELLYGPVAKPEPVTAKAMEGDWQTGLPDYGCSSILLGGCTCRYTFIGDSFYCRRSCFTDAANPADTCGQGFECELFIRGTFSISQDSIVTRGFFTDSNFNIRNTGCAYGCRVSGPFNQAYQYQLCGNTIMLVDRSYYYGSNPSPVIWMQKQTATPARHTALSSPRPVERIIETGYNTVSGRKLSLTPGQIRTYRGVVITVQRTETGRVEVKRGLGNFR
jgi:hypothetical protein